MKIVGHRGAAGLAPENTIKSIQAALSLNVDAVEIDVRITKDRKLVIVHDDNLSKTCGIDTKIRDLTLSQIARIPTISGEPIPTLDDVLKTTGKNTIFVEPKDSDMFEELMLSTRNSIADIRFTTREHDLLTKIKSSSPRAKIYPTNDWFWRSLSKQVKSLNADGISINYSLLNPLMLWLIKRLKIDMLIFTVDEVNQIEKANRLFPEAWLCTNRPDIAITTLKK